MKKFQYSINPDIDSLNLDKSLTLREVALQELSH